MNTLQVIEAASGHLRTLSGHIFDLLTISKPVSPAAAINLAKVISKNIRCLYHRGRLYSLYARQSLSQPT